MIKHLTKIGNSLGIIVDRPILERLNIGRDTELEIWTDGIGLTIRPVRKDGADRLEAAIGQVTDDHAETFKKLAQ